MAKPDAFGVIVADLAVAAAFYRRLGLEFPEDLDPEGHGHVESGLPGGMRLMLDSEETIRSFDPGWTPPSAGHRTALGFLCDSPADVDSTFDELVAAGGKPYKEPWDAFWGHRYAQVLDPDGNMVELFAPL